MLLGGAELGRLAYAAIEVTNAAKAAVQYGDQSNGTASDLTGMLLAANADAANIPGGVAWASGSPTYQFACSNTPDVLTAPIPVTGIPNLTITCPNAQIVETVTVELSTQFDPLIHLPGLPTTFTLYGYATQKVLGN